MIRHWVADGVCGNENASHHLGTCIFIHNHIISAIKTVEFISDRMSYVTIRGHWCDIIIIIIIIIIMNMHAPTEDKSDDMKVAFTTS
jgi:hypothetical protein